MHMDCAHLAADAASCVGGSLLVGAAASGAKQPIICGLKQIINVLEELRVRQVANVGQGVAVAVAATCTATLCSRKPSKQRLRAA